MEKELGINPEEINKKSILDEGDIKEFIEFREISEDDFELIKKLSEFPKDYFIELHNFFSLSKDSCEVELERMIELNDKNNKKEFYSTWLDLTKKYHWTTAWNLNGIFEKRDRNKFIN